MSAFEWREAVASALRAYGSLSDLEQSPLAGAHCVQKRRPPKMLGANEAHFMGLAVRRLLDDALLILQEQQPDAAALLRDRYEQQMSMRLLSRKRHIPESTLYEHHGKAVTSLASIVMRLDAEARSESMAVRNQLLAALPAPTYQTFVGFERHLEQIGAVLEDRTSVGYPVYVTGLGGLGKTSLTREALARWIQSSGVGLEQCAWVTVGQSTQSLSMQNGETQRRFALDNVLSSLGLQLAIPIDDLPNNERRMRALADKLLETPAVVVIDNVETPDEVAVAHSVSRALAAVARIFVTSRRRIDVGNGLTLVLSELSEEEAIRLLQLESERLGLSGIGADAWLQIYRQIGGNPHALKLVTAQLRYLPLEIVLRDFAVASSTAQRLFTQIYNTAWNLLTDEAQRTLLGLWLTPPEGTDWTGLRTILGQGNQALAESKLEQIIAELSSLNLIQISAPPAPRYSLHRLTYHFIESRLGLRDGDNPP